MESVAFQKAETYFKQSYDGTIQKCGWKLSNTHSYNIGASADGLVCCPTLGKGVLEIKCPYELRDYTKEDILKETGYLIEMVNGEPQLKRNNNCFAQMQFQMNVWAFLHAYKQFYNV